MSKCKCPSVSVQRIFRKNPSQCFREKNRLLYKVQILEGGRKLDFANWRGDLELATVEKLKLGGFMCGCNSQQVESWIADSLVIVHRLRGLAASPQKAMS